MNTIEQCMKLGAHAEVQRPKNLFAALGLASQVHLISVPRTSIDCLDKVSPRITFPANPSLSIMMGLKLDNSSKRVALKVSFNSTIQGKVPTLDSFILTTSGSNGFKLTILDPSFISRNMYVSSILSEEGKTSLLTN